MALPIVDDSTALTSANLHGFMYGDEDTYMAMACWNIRWIASLWLIDANFGSSASRSDIAVVWDGVNNQLDVDLTNLTFNGATFAGYPCAFASPFAHTADGTWNYDVQAITTSATDIAVRFADMNPGASSAFVTSENVKMYFNLMVVGRIA